MLAWRRRRVAQITLPPQKKSHSPPPPKKLASHLHQLTRELLQLPLAQRLWVNGHAPLCAAKGDVHDSGLPGHEGREAGFVGGGVVLLLTLLMISSRFGSLTIALTKTTQAPKRGCTAR